MRSFVYLTAKDKFAFCPSTDYTKTIGTSFFFPGFAKQDRVDLSPEENEKLTTVKSLKFE